jgi:hypothetical protein
MTNKNAGPILPARSQVKSAAASEASPRDDKKSNRQPLGIRKLAVLRSRSTSAARGSQEISVKSELGHWRRLTVGPSLPLRLISLRSANGRRVPTTDARSYGAPCYRSFVEAWKVGGLHWVLSTASPAIRFTVGHRCHPFASTQGQSRAYGFAARRPFGVVVQCRQRLKNIVNGHQAARARQLSLSRVRCHRNSIRRPGCEDGTLFGDRYCLVRKD